MDPIILAACPEGMAPRRGHKHGEKRGDNARIARLIRFNCAARPSELWAIVGRTHGGRAPESSASSEKGHSEGTWRRTERGRRLNREDTGRRRDPFNIVSCLLVCSIRGTKVERK